MPLISGRLLSGRGAVATVRIAVSGVRQALLRKHRFPVPAPVEVQAQIDTGATVSAFNPTVFARLGISPLELRPVLTPSTTPDQPHDFPFYHVLLALVANGQPHELGEFEVMAADCWLEGEGVEALIGQDILERCVFEYAGQHGTFNLAF